MKNPNILNITTIYADWCDNDMIMLHACFQLLTDCIEQEHLLTGNNNWNHNDETRHAKTELKELYNWWAKRKNEEESFNGEQAEAQYNKDNEMLIRLIKVRKHLWT